MRIPRTGVSNEDSINDTNGDTTNSSNYSRSNTKSWTNLKEEGRVHYQSQNYNEALECYRAALVQRGISDYDKQMILSNIVACRLKIGTRAQTEVALLDAKKCISLNDRWSKGHVRLASVYIALSRSNDACNSLQRALTLDPSNQVARNMLTSELRRERVGPSAPPVEVEEDVSPSAPPFEDERVGASVPTEDIRSNDLEDDTLPFRERLQFMAGWYYEKLYSWQSNLSDDTRSFLQVCIVLIILYVLLGGRFGLANNASNRGNYNHGNAYDQFYNSYSSNSRRTSEYAYSSPHHSSSSHYSSGDYASSSLMSQYDLTNIFSLLLVFTVMYLAHKYAGINPFQALWVMNLMNRRGGMGYGRGGFGWGGGAGFGRYFGAPRYHGRRHGFRRW